MEQICAAAHICSAATQAPYTEPDDNFILALIRDGHKSEGISLLVKKYQNMVVGFCVNMMPKGEGDRGFDIAQEALVAWYEKIDTFRRESSLRTWLFAIRDRRGDCLLELAEESPLR
jgi:hypothetical protein